MKISRFALVVRFAFCVFAVAVSTAHSMAQVGGAWFVEKDQSQPVVVAPAYTWKLGQSAWELQLSGLLRPTDSVRLGGAVNLSFPLGRPTDESSREVEFRGLFGIGSLFGDRFDNVFQNLRPGIVAGFTVRW